jgi:hypothetical protein
MAHLVTIKRAMNHFFAIEDLKTLHKLYEFLHADGKLPWHISWRWSSGIHVRLSTGSILANICFSLGAPTYVRAELELLHMQHSKKAFYSYLRYNLADHF